MKCKNQEMLMILDIYGELTKKEQKKLHHHLTSCSTCSEKCIRLKEEYSLLNFFTCEPLDFNWDESWRVIKKGISHQGKKSPFHIPRNRWMLRTAATFIIFLLGFITGRFFSPPPQENHLVFKQNPIISMELKQHFESVEAAIIEYANFRTADMETQLLMFEKKRISNLLAHNRLLKKYIQNGKHLFLKQLLDDIEIILLEVANLKMNNNEYLTFIKDLLEEKEIFFKIKYFNNLTTIDSNNI